MKKTKKEKIEAEARRERFLYSLSAIQQTPKKEMAREEPKQKEKFVQPTFQTQAPSENFFYLRQDLARIVVLALIAFVVQIVLYLTIF
jgi:hypothetical protein